MAPFRFLLLVMVGALGACRGQGVVGALSQLTVAPLAVDFGEVVPGSQAEQAVVITNGAAAPITIAAIAFAQVEGTGLSCVGCQPLMLLQSQERLTLKLLFAPTSRRLATATVTIRSDAENAGELAIRVAGNSRCVPENDAAFCGRLGRDCGKVSAEDNCDVARVVTSCGSCSGGAQCGSSNVCGCDGESDQALCVPQSRQCGSFTGKDRCGALRAVASCGTCAATSQRCAANGQCECVPEPDEALCTSSGRACGGLSTVDRCGVARTIASCGSCNSVCDASGQCACLPPTDAELCAAQSPTCGRLSMTDRCGTPRDIASCGSCSGTNVKCGGGGRAGQCGCTGELDSALCASANRACGSLTATDRCGASRSVVSCGACTAVGATCGGGGLAGQCGCTPESDATLCAAQTLRCGPAIATDRCGVSRVISSCGTCANPAHGMSLCASGTCDYACNPGYARSGSICVTSCGGAAQTALPFAGGSGTSSDPYLICTAAQLQSLRITAGQVPFYKLIDDIDLKGVTFPPIGTTTAPFKGYFHGGDFSISNWSFSDPSADQVALFGYAAGQVTNLRLVNVQVTGRDYVGAVAHGLSLQDVWVSGLVTGRDYVGGFSGHVNISGTRLHSAADVHGRSSVGGIFGSMAGSSLIDSSTTGAVVATGSGAGGLVGRIAGESFVRGCSATGDVTGLNSVGGLVGEAQVIGRYSALSQSSAAGTVRGGDAVGGLVGATDVPVLNSYATGGVIGTSRVGGLVGQADTFIAHSYASGAVTGTSNVGGLVGVALASPLVFAADSFWDTARSGLPTSALGAGKTTAQLSDAATFTKWNAYAIWNVGGASPTFRTAPVPCIAGATGFAGGSGTAASPYLIDQVSQIYNMRCNTGEVFKLARSLDFASQPMVPAVNVDFYGVFDGDDKTLSNWVNYDVFQVALFSALQGSAIVRNLTLSQAEVGGVQTVAPAVGSLRSGTVSRVRTSGIVRGLYGVGGMAGEVAGGFIERSSCGASVTGARAIGGCIGVATNGAVSNDASTGAVISSVSPAVYAGGFLGQLSGATVSRCYSIGAVPFGAGFATGYAGTATDNYWDTTTSGQATSTYGTGKTTAQMQVQTTYPGWDFASVWDLQGNQYPSLR